jgi:site-specific DNA recombinase
MGSGVRVIVLNERYRGLIHWNTSECSKDPDSGKRQRIMRPRPEWITHTDKSLRIVSDELFSRAQRRMRPAQDPRSIRSGGKPKYLLSGLLRCDVCDAHYIGVNGVEYGCSSHRDGGAIACSNGVRIRRDRVEDVMVGRLRDDLLTPASIRQITQDMQAYFLERSRAMEAQRSRRRASFRNSAHVSPACQSA